MSSVKLSASHSQSMRPWGSLLGANSTWRKPKAAVAGSSVALSIRDLRVVGEVPDGRGGERAARGAAGAGRAGARGALSRPALRGGGECPDGVGGERAARVATVAVGYHEAAVGAGADDLRE